MFAAVIPQVHAFVRLRIDAAIRHREPVSDIVQSACREVLDNPGFEFRGEAAFRSYLCQAALHKLQARRRHWQADKRDARREAADGLPEVEVREVYRTTMFDPLRKAIRGEEILQLEAAFDKLPEDYREALALYRIAGMPVAQLAQHLGRTEVATRMLLSRAMARLTSILKPE